MCTRDEHMYIFVTVRHSAFSVSIAVAPLLCFQACVTDDALACGNSSAHIAPLTSVKE